MAAAIGPRSSPYTHPLLVIEERGCHWSSSMDTPETLLLWPWSHSMGGSFPQRVKNRACSYNLDLQPKGYLGGKCSGFAKAGLKGWRVYFSKRCAGFQPCDSLMSMGIMLLKLCVVLWKCIPICQFSFLGEIIKTRPCGTFFFFLKKVFSIIC